MSFTNDPWEPEHSTIIECVVGSTVHGLNLPGNDDLDTMGVCIEPHESVTGLNHFEQHVSRSKPEGVRSSAGDVDSVIYSLRKWMKLAVAGNPSILTLLFVPPEHVIQANLLGYELQKMSPYIVSKLVYAPFYGYMKAQYERLIGARGQKRCNRIEHHVSLQGEPGWDSKYAMHMLRLGIQGTELLKTGHITLPMPDFSRGMLLSVRKGERTLADVTAMYNQLSAEISVAWKDSPLPEQPNYKAVNEFLYESHARYWPLPKPFGFRKAGV